MGKRKELVVVSTAAAPLGLLVFVSFPAGDDNLAVDDTLAAGVVTATVAADGVVVAFCIASNDEEDDDDSFPCAIPTEFAGLKLLLKCIPSINSSCQRRMENTDTNVSNFHCLFKKIGCVVGVID
jgi:hypothetical protein